VRWCGADGISQTRRNRGKMGKGLSQKEWIARWVTGCRKWEGRERGREGGRVGGREGATQKKSTYLLVVNGGGGGDLAEDHDHAGLGARLCVKEYVGGSDGEGGGAEDECGEVKIRMATNPHLSSTQPHLKTQGSSPAHTPLLPCPPSSQTYRRRRGSSHRP